MSGLKNVRSRRHDSLSRVRWDALESLLATYYRGQGYQVEHCGTGGTCARFDGGIDMKLRRDDQYILVQCKHWNAKQVPHNDVHQLLGIMVNEGATGAILVTSGEFTKAAIEVATRQGHVQLIDGEELREMIGPVPEPQSPSDFLSPMDFDLTPMVREERLTDFKSNQQPVGLVWKIAAGVILGLLVVNFLGNAVADYRQRKVLEMFAEEMKRISSDPDPLGWRAAAAARQRSNVQVSKPQSYMPAAAPRRYVDPVEPAPAAADVREQQRKADEAIRVLKASTPEM